MRTDATICRVPIQCGVLGIDTGKIGKNIFQPKSLTSNQTELDKKLIYSLSKSKIPNIKQFKYIKK